MSASQNATHDDRVGQIPPPEGVIPDFDNPRDAGHLLNIVGIALCCFFITVFFFIRAYVRIFINRRLLLSDYACFLGWVFTLLYGGTCFAMSYWGLGYHAWEVTPYDYSQVLKWLYASSVVYNPAAFCVKLTILLLIARVFAVREFVAKGIHIFIFFLAIAYMPVQTLKTFVCTPIRAYWEPHLVPSYGCINQRRLFITDLTLAVLADLVIVLVPIPVTWSMRLPLHKKLKIIFMLGCGSLATGVTVFRLTKVVLFLNARDVTYDFVVLDLTTCVELSIGIVCACLPSAHFLYERRRANRRIRDESNRPRTGRFGGGGGPKLSTSATSWWSTRKTLRSLHLTSWTNHNATEARTASPGPERTPSMAEAAVLPIPPPPASRGHGPRLCCRGDTEADLSCDQVRRSAQRAFDLELAQFAGYSLDDEEAGSSPPLGGGGCPVKYHPRSRVNSLDGRREGWLAPRSDADETTDVEGAHDMGPPEPIRYWDSIWDGTVDSMPR